VRKKQNPINFNSIQFRADAGGDDRKADHIPGQAVIGAKITLDGGVFFARGKEADQHHQEEVSQANGAVAAERSVKWSGTGKGPKQGMSGGMNRKPGNNAPARALRGKQGVQIINIFILTTRALYVSNDKISKQASAIGFAV